jgi:hypothetical protein
VALLTSELRRIREELGYNVLDAGADPYISIYAVFDQVIAVYMQGGASTTSSTTVTAASTATPVTLTLASATGFTAGDNVAIDVDDRYEQARVQAVSGSTITVLLQLAHSGTYPVTVEGGEMIVREILREIAKVKARMGQILTIAGLKRADEVEWYPAMKGQGPFAELRNLLNFWRDELASTLGVQNLWRVRRGGGVPVLY